MTGCATSGAKTRDLKLPPVPADIARCFDGVVPAPRKGAMTKRDVLALIAKLKLSETEKAACGKRLLKLYETFT